MTGDPPALDAVQAVLARLEEERERTGGYSRETWDALCAHLRRLAPDDAARLGEVVRRTRRRRGP